MSRVRDRRVADGIGDAVSAGMTICTRPLEWLLVYNRSGPESTVHPLVVDPIARLAGRMRDADRAPETSCLRSGEDEVDVGDAQRTEILPPRRTQRRLEHAEPAILEREPLHELGPQLRWHLERLDLALLRLHEREGAGDGVDHVCGLGDVGWPDPIEPWPIDSADRGHACQVLRLCRLGSRARGEDEDDRCCDSGRQDGAGCAEERAPTSQRSHHQLTSPKGRFRIAVSGRRGHGYAASFAGRAVAMLTTPTSAR